MILINGFREDFQSCTCEKKQTKTASGAVTPTSVDGFENFGIGPSNDAERYYSLPEFH